MWIDDRRPIQVIVVIVLASFGVGWSAVTAQAEDCGNEQLRERDAYTLRLPDCRAYEQASPADKGYADALGAPGLVQSSPSGNQVTFFALSAFPTNVAGSAEFPTYLSTRHENGPAEWLTQGLLPPTAPAAFVEVVALTSDLSKTIIFDLQSNPPLTEEATPGKENYYVRDNATKFYKLLAPHPEFGTSVADYTPTGSRILFESNAHLLPNAAPEVPNLYEWNNGVLSVASILPTGEGGDAPLGGSVAGAGASSEHYTEHTISKDGTRVFFTDLTNGHLYVREKGEVTIPVSTGLGHFLAATPDGRYVFYTDAAGELWRFDVDNDTPQELAGAVGGAIGVLGVSDDGSYAYFVNHSNSLYEWHEGAGLPILITGLTSPLSKGVEGARGDEDDWVDSIQNIGEGPAGGGRKSSLVTPDGKAVVFFKGSSLLLYNASTGKLQPIAADAFFGKNHLETIIKPRSPFMTHNLSEDGDQVFFETEEALVPQDTNGLMDVYEWEQEGSGSCTRASPNFRDSSEGCIYLISTGQGNTPSYFGDASIDGRSVFFFTRQSLVGQDQDNNVDLYDARVDGGIAAQDTLDIPTTCVGDACLGIPNPPPMIGEPSSSVLSGTGNFTSPASNPRIKPNVLAPKRLAKALRLCRRKPKRKRVACEVLAKKKYGRGSIAETAKRLGRTHRTAREKVL